MHEDDGTSELGAAFELDAEVEAPGTLPPMAKAGMTAEIEYHSFFRPTMLKEMSPDRASQ